MHKYLILNFQNAKLFTPHGKTKDYVLDINGKTARTLTESFVEPLTVYQISNVLHVLFGERPVSSMRLSFYKKNDYLFEKAKNSLLRIDNFKIPNKYTKELGFIREKVALNKASWNSTSSTLHLYWEKFRRILKEDNFNILIEKLEDILLINPLEYTLIEICFKVRELNNLELIEWLRSINKNMVANFFNPNVTLNIATTDLNKTTPVQSNTNKGIDDPSILKGSIIVPVSDEDIKIISDNKGCATILDGGLVHIVGIKYGSEIDDYGFTKVGDISTEKKIIFIKKEKEKTEEDED